MAAMDMAEWSVVKDGSLHLGEKTTALTYHPKLNTILAVTGGSNVRVVDVNSGVSLQKSTLSGKERGPRIVKKKRGRTPHDSSKHFVQLSFRLPELLI